MCIADLNQCEYCVACQYDTLIHLTGLCVWSLSGFASGALRLTSDADVART